MAEERPKATVEVPSQGGEEPDEFSEQKMPHEPILPTAELSAEDEALKESLEAAIEQLKSADDAVVGSALALMRKEICEATASMTSVPKPLKFLNPHYDVLKRIHPAIQDAENKKTLADIISVLGMVKGSTGDNDTLVYKLQGNTSSLEEWGHEYVRSLAGEIGQEFERRQLLDPVPPCDDLLGLVHTIVPFHFSHNAEPEAMDLLMETKAIDTLRTSNLVDKKNYTSVCLYILRCADYLDDKEECTQMLEIAYDVYLRQAQFCDALRVALRMRDNDRCMAVFAATQDEPLRKQMACILGRHRVELELDEDDLLEYAGNNGLTDVYADLARELDVMEPKTPEQIYKSHLSETGTTARDAGGKQVESARNNLASTFVNAFVNAGFCKDLLMSPADSTWVHKNQGSGVISAAASHGMVLMWSIDSMTQLDKLLYSNDENIKAGGLLSVGICCASIRNESDPALALLTDYLEDGTTHSNKLRAAAIMGLGIAYAGTGRDDVQELLSPYVADDSGSMELVSLASLALGMVYVGSANLDVATLIADRLMEASDTERSQPLVRHMCLGLGLVFLGKEEAVTAMVETMHVIEHPVAAFGAMVLQACAYTGTGNVLQVQQLLHKCAEHPAEDASAETKKNDGMVQSAAVLGIALVTMGEDTGAEMATRMSEHLLAYGDVAVKRAVPLGLALLHLSDPEYTIVDTLSKLTHDADAGVAQNAIIALGLLGAGTNNSRIAGLLRMLVTFYKSEPDHVFCVRIAQGLLHMGKGLITIAPQHSDRLLTSQAALAGILPVLFCGLDMQSTLLGDYHYLLYTLAAAMMPRMLVVLDEDMNPMHIDVRVGQAVDTVGQAGQPKTITGFQTHQTPVLLAAGERAMLATGQYLPLSSVLEGVVIVRPNPEWDEEAETTGMHKADKRVRTASTASAAGAGAGAAVGTA